MAAVMLPIAARPVVEHALQDAMLQCSQAAALTTEQMSALRQTLEGTSVRLMSTIISCMATPDTDRKRLLGASTLSTTDQPVSPYLKPLPAPPVDSEVLDLQAQVAAACQRVAGLRATVPNQLAEQLTKHLQQCRPASHDTPDRDAQPAMLDDRSQTVADHGSFLASEMVSNPAVSTEEAWPEPQANTLSMTPLSPAPAELQSMYTAAVQRMPALRAKLEQALERMDRVVQAVERDNVQASPYTAQLADQLGNNDATDSLSPALQQALQSGKVVTRRQLTKDVHPVPYAT